MQQMQTINLSSLKIQSNELFFQCSLKFNNCIPEKRGYYGSRTVIIRVRRDFLVFNQQATFLLGFLLNFASGLLWQRSGHPIVLLAQESKLCSGESKILTIACVQAVGHSFFQIYFIFSAWISGYDVSPPYFCRPGVKIKRVIYGYFKARNQKPKQIWLVTWKLLNFV